jgi:hypothetical protein
MPSNSSPLEPFGKFAPDRIGFPPRSGPDRGSFPPSASIRLPPSEAFNSTASIRVIFSDYHSRKIRRSFDIRARRAE